MRGKVKVFTLASVALLSCRGILGIEDIEEGTADGGTVTSDAAADSVGTDSATTDTGIETGADAGCAKGSGCNVCCREPLKGTSSLPEIEKVAKNAGCICGSGKCIVECPEICGAEAGMPQPTCIQCLDNELINGTFGPCGKALDDCEGNATCKPVGVCFRACKP